MTAFCKSQRLEPMETPQLLQHMNLLDKLRQMLRIYYLDSGVPQGYNRAVEMLDRAVAAQNAQGTEGEEEERETGRKRDRSPSSGSGR